MFLAGHQTGRIYPVSLVIFFVSIVLLIGFAVRGGSLGGSVAGAIILAVGYRFTILYIPETTIGEATTRNARWMESVIAEGTTSVIPSTFYREAPLHILQSSMTAMMLDIHSQQTFYIYALLFGILLPIVAITLIRLMGVTDKRALAVAALLVIATTEGIRRSYWVIPQVQAAVWYWLILLLLSKLVKTPLKRFYGLLLVLTVAIALTHKLPLLIVGLVIGFLLALYAVDSVTWKTAETTIPLRQAMSALLILGTVTLAQWLYVGDHIDHVVARVLRIFAAEAPTGGSSGHDPIAAIPARTGLLAEIYAYPTWLTLYIERAHIFWLLLIGGIAWCYLLFRTADDDSRSGIYVLLASAAGSVILIPISVATIDALNPTRLLVLGEPIIVVLAVGMVAKIYETSSIDVPWVKVFFVLLLATQVFAASAAPDYANTPRYYLDTPEAHANTMLCQYSQEPVYTDQNFHRLEGIDRESCGIYDRYSREPTDALYNANVTTDEHPTIAYRHDLDLYQGEGARWHLTWDPEQEFDSQYSSIYSNKQVTAYHHAG